MRRQFVEYLGNAWITSYSWCAGGLLEADSHVGLLEGPQHQFNMNNIYL
jgi:hypothetical protein